MLKKMIQKKNNKTCEIHDLSKTLFCMDEGCKFALCYECYIEQHIGHQKAKLEDVWEANKSSATAALEFLEHLQGQFDAKVRATDQEIEKLTK